ncbi:hypothetical protein DMC30DRAFT_401428 [Rhodotorula diobovata]|uniref:Uncharacterized protein n=1 Tax=Rhodotorula diobovata TaxID=5288 RepID=A0A5C5FQI2_9BASI|nr:hypothetical protein DMC30DRAFT_401428 [Rhodotorula diobovata]
MSVSARCNAARGALCRALPAILATLPPSRPALPSSDSRGPLASLQRWRQSAQRSAELVYAAHGASPACPASPPSRKFARHQHRQHSAGVAHRSRCSPLLPALRPHPQCRHRRGQPHGHDHLLDASPGRPRRGFTASGLWQPFRARLPRARFGCGPVAFRSWRARSRRARSWHRSRRGRGVDHVAASRARFRLGNARRAPRAERAAAAFAPERVRACRLGSQERHHGVSAQPRQRGRQTPKRQQR